MCVRESVCESVCVRERESEKEKERDRDREREREREKDALNRTATSMPAR